MGKWLLIGRGRRREEFFCGWQGPNPYIQRLLKSQNGAAQGISEAQDSGDASRVSRWETCLTALSQCGPVRRGKFSSTKSLEPKHSETPRLKSASVLAYWCRHKGSQWC